MRFFILVCILGLLVSAVGCASPTWGRWWQRDTQPTDEYSEMGDQRRTDWSVERQPGGLSLGIDSRAKDIERNLGYE